ncbi:hypothetical protein GH714_012224 [Hevea brasiliensis]|uniref:hAT-like transposase RNase-H fold domain-containing protein n=1 Tax=Hevea brasiliensis TaxID=3981 RepID=A0A6A6M9Q1_HEVBR|nr:hypothetical protein GH714_012224 [Hevea brasiliensis]
MDTFTKWNIETKISTITVDNCSTNDGMISIILEKLYGDLLYDGAILNMRCCAHIFNLIVKDVLSTIEHSLARIRDSVAFWLATPQRVENFEEVAKQVKLSYGKKLSLDCKTRWNSTYLMLQTAIQYNDVFPRLRIREKHHTNVPTELDWELANKVAEKLQHLYAITQLFSGRKYLTTNCFFIQICDLRINMVEWMNSDGEIIKATSSKIFEKFEKYWSVVHIVLAVVVILDPRYKMKVVEFYFPMIYGENALSEIEQVKTTFYNLFNDYQSQIKSKYHGTSILPTQVIENSSFYDSKYE